MFSGLSIATLSVLLSTWSPRVHTVAIITNFIVIMLSLKANKSRHSYLKCALQEHVPYIALNEQSQADMSLLCLDILSIPNDAVWFPGLICWVSFPEMSNNKGNSKRENCTSWV